MNYISQSSKNVYDTILLDLYKSIPKLYMNRFVYCIYSRSFRKQLKCTLARLHAGKWFVVGVGINIVRCGSNNYGKIYAETNFIYLGGVCVVYFFMIMSAVFYIVSTKRLLRFFFLYDHYKYILCL